MAPSLRHKLQGIFGTATVHAIAEACENANVLWSDDLAVARVCASELGTRYTWTQHVFSKWSSIDTSLQSTSDDMNLFITQCRVRFTRLDPRLLEIAGNQTHWNVDDQRLKGVFRHFRHDDTLPIGIVLLAVAAIRSCRQNTPLSDRFTTVVGTIAREILRRKDGKSLCADIVRRLDGAFVMDVIGATMAKEQIRRAMRGSLD